MTTYRRTEYVTRRVEFVIETKGLDYVEVEKMIQVALQELRALGVTLGDNSVQLVPRDDAIVVTYTVDVPIEQNPESSVTLDYRRRQLAEALGVYQGLAWSHMINIVEARQREASPVGRSDAKPTEPATSADPNAPIVALLPRNWPQVIENQVELDSAKRVCQYIDDWVLAATDQGGDDAER